MGNEISNNLQKQILSIVDIGDKEREIKKRVMWYNHHRMRNDFLSQCKEDGLSGKEYSNAVIQWDKMHGQIFQEEWGKA